MIQPHVIGEQKGLAIGKSRAVATLIEFPRIVVPEADPTFINRQNLAVHPVADGADIAPQIDVIGQADDVTADGY